MTASRQSRRRRRTGTVARIARVLAPAVALAVTAGGAQAATITVTTTAGAAGADGGCALPEAIQNANADAQTHADCTAGAGADEIGFAPGLSGTVALASALPSITGTLTIDGPGADVLTVSGGGAHRPLDVLAGATVAISGVTVADGSDTTGGGIENQGTLTLTGVSLANNQATWGGGVLNWDGATMVLEATTLTGNSAMAGGGAYSMGSLTVTDSAVTGNSASSGGGGLANGSGGDMLVTGTTVSGNSSTSASTGGGGISNAATATVVNSTVSGNTATFQGGGIRNLGTLTVTNSTLAGNSGAPFEGGGLSSPMGTMTVRSSIVGDSPAGGDCAGTGTFTDSLVEDGTCGAGGSGGNVTGDPLLGPLQDNGGPTLTHSLLPGSPAIDAGANPEALVTDQRGAGFPRTIGAGTDAGAVEVDAAAPVVVTLSPADDAVDVAPGTDLVATFDEPIALGTSGEVTLHRSDDDSPVAGADVSAPGAALVVAGDTLTFAPGAALPHATGYYVTIDAGAVEDLAGNPFAGIAGAADWSFETAPDPTPPDPTPPDPGPADPAPGPTGPPAAAPPAGDPAAAAPATGAAPAPAPATTPRRRSARTLVPRGWARLASAAAARRFVAERGAAGDRWIAAGRDVVDVPRAMERLREVRVAFTATPAAARRSAERERSAGRTSLARPAGSRWVVISGAPPARGTRAG